LETCTIERWRGYRSSTFFAYLEDGTPLLESDSFRTRGAEGPERGAYDQIVAALEELGWERDPNSFGAWYETRFVRWVEAPEEDPVAADPPGPDDHHPQPTEVWREPTDVAPRRAEVMPPPAATTLPPFAGPPPPAAARPALFAAAPLPVAAQTQPAEPPAAHAEPPPADRRDSAPRRRLRISTIVAVAGAAVALVVVALGMTGHGKQLPFLRNTATHAGLTTPGAQTLAASPKQAPALPAAKTAKGKAPKHAAAAPAKTLRLSIRARGQAWLEVRSRSRSGPVVFSGVLAAGRKLDFKGAAFWARFGAAGNLTIAVNGNRVPLKGTVEHMFVAPQR
jgi:hypothetical protein